jgi:hypothetical protein
MRAAELAQSRRFVEAEELLSPDGKLPNSPRDLDLLARIAVHNRRFSQARSLWEQILKSDPTNEAARGALARLDSSWIAISLMKPIALVIGAIVVLGFCVVGLFSTFSSAQHRKSLSPESTTVRVLSPPPLQQPREQSPARTTGDSSSESLAIIAQNLSNSIATEFRIRDNQLREIRSTINVIQSNQATVFDGQENAVRQIAKIALTLDVLNAQQGDSRRLLEQTRRDIQGLSESEKRAAQILSQTPPPSNHTAHLDFQIKGVTLIPRPGFWIVRFSTGIFDRDDHFRTGSKKMLQSVAQALVRSQEKLRIEVVGYAESESATWPWLKPLSDKQLGLIRGEKTQRFLESLKIFPPNSVRAKGGSAQERPFSDGSTDNRTVVFWIYAE